MSKYAQDISDFIERPPITSCTIITCMLHITLVLVIRDVVLPCSIQRRDNMRDLMQNRDNKEWSSPHSNVA